MTALADVPDRPSSTGAGERRNAVRGVAWGGVESAVTAAVGFLLTPLIVHVAGIEGLGLWSVSWSLAHASGLFDFGVGGSYARFTARAIATGDTPALNGTVGAGVGFHLTLSLLIGVSALVLGRAAVARLAPPGPLATAAPVILGCILAQVLIRLTLSAYRGVVAGAQRIDLLGRVGAAAALVEGCGGAAVLLSGGGLRGLAMNSLAVGLLQSAAEGVAAHRLCPMLRIRPFRARRSEWREFLSFGLRLQATRAAEILGAHAPRLALAAGPGLLSAGVYDLGARVAGGLQVLGGLPLPVIQPLATRLQARGDLLRLRRLVERSTRYVALLVLPCAALLLLDARAILVAWTGRDVPVGAALSARWLAAAAAVTLLASPTRLALRGLGFPGTEAAAVLSGSVLNLGLAVACASPFGAGGVAAAALGGSLLSAAIVDHGARKRARSGLGGPARPLLVPLVIALVAFAAGAALRAEQLVSGPELVSRTAAVRCLLPEAMLVGSVFLLGAILAGQIGRDDLEVVRDIAPILAPAALRSGSGGRE